MRAIILKANRQNSVSTCKNEKKQQQVLTVLNRRPGLLPLSFPLHYPPYRFMDAGDAPFRLILEQDLKWTVHPYPKKRKPADVIPHVMKKKRKKMNAVMPPVGTDEEFKQCHGELVDRMLYGILEPQKRWSLNRCHLCLSDVANVVYRSSSFVTMQFYGPQKPHTVYSIAPPVCRNCNFQVMMKRRMVLEETWFFATHGQQFFYELFNDDGQASEFADMYTSRVAKYIMRYLLSNLFHDRAYLKSLNHEFDYLAHLLLTRNVIPHSVRKGRKKMGDKIAEEILVQITDGMMEDIFRNYNAVSYGHLLVMPIKTDETMEKKREVLSWWLEQFAIGDGEDDERQDAVLEASKNKPRALEDLVFALSDDQYFQEPLYHMLNQDRRDPDLSMFRRQSTPPILPPSSPSPPSL